jgi:hypothetical protein
MSIWAQCVVEPKNIGFDNLPNPYVFGFVATQFFTLFFKYFREINQKIAKNNKNPKTICS